MKNNEEINYGELLDTLETHLELMKGKKLKKGDTLYDQYFKPLSDEHVKYLGIEFDMDFDLDNNYLQYVFARFVKSWYNGTGKAFISEGKMRIEIKTLLCNFNYDDFIEKDSNDCVKLFNEVIEHPKDYEKLFGIRRRTDLMYFCEGVCSIAKVLEKFLNQGLITRDSNQVQKLSRSNHCIRDYINTSIEKDLVGMSWTLLSDAVKEAGLFDLAKPDVHIIDVLNEFYKAKKIDMTYKMPQNSKQFIDFHENIRQIYENNQSKLNSIYELDKKMWISCARFYFHNDKGEDNRKQVLLGKIKNLSA